MKALCILALLAAASPALAQAPAEKPGAPSQDQKPFVYDGPGAKDFTPPSPVAIGPSPAQDRAPVRPPTPKTPGNPEAKPAPEPAPGNA